MFEWVILFIEIIHHEQLQEIPLMYQLLVSGNQQHSEEQVWVMQLLAAGLRGPLDAQLYRSFPYTPTVVLLQSRSA